MTSDDVLEGLVEECQEDQVGLWRIVNAIWDDLGLPSGLRASRGGSFATMRNSQ
jgi:hypothetical protein